MNPAQLKKLWQQEEAIAHVHGWDFSHIAGRCVETPLPWDYRQTIDKYRTPTMGILDYDTGGGEFLLSLNHPYGHTAATEGYAPNVSLCRDTLLPLGIDFRPCEDPAHVPFPDESFDLILNRHGNIHAGEVHRLLKKGGLFITQQVGAENDRDLVNMVLPHTPVPFPDSTLAIQKNRLKTAGLQILEEAEAFCPTRFYDIGAFVWFARIIPWEFPGFSVERCFDNLMDTERRLQKIGYLQGTIHRFLLVARK